MVENLDMHKKAIIYACKVCVLNIKRKGVAPAYIMKMMKDLMQINLNTMNNPGYIICRLLLLCEVWSYHEQYVW